MSTLAPMVLQYLDAEQVVLLTNQYREKPGVILQ